MKTTYEDVMIEVIKFNQADILTTSGNIFGDNDMDSPWGEEEV